MGNVVFRAPADPYRGYRSPIEPTAGSWVRQYVSRYLRRPYPKITYPRPRSERTSFLHTEWDKWIAGLAWSPRIAIKDGMWPYKVFLSGSYPSGTTWAWYIEEENGVATPYLRVYNANPPQGTFSFQIVAIGQNYYRSTVDVQVTFWDPADANIRNQFRVIDPAAGGGGDGAPATPYNNWDSMYGATYTDSTVLVIVKGTTTVTSVASPLALGVTKPKQVIGVIGSAWEFNLTSIGANGKFTASSSDGSDIMLKNFAIRGQAAAGANQSQIGQANTRDRVSLHDLDFYDLNTSGSNNHGCFGGDGDERRYYLTVLGCTATNVGAGGTNCEIITFEQVDALVDDYQSITPNTSNKSFAAIHFKHDNRDVEVRRMLANNAESYGYSPLHFGSGGSSASQPLYEISGVVRHSLLAASTNGGFTACLRFGADSPDTHYMAILRNTLIGQVARVGFDTDVAAYMFYDGNIFQNSDTNGLGSVSNEAPLAPEVAVIGDNINASSGLVDASGNPINAAHIGRYGHRLV